MKKIPATAEVRTFLAFKYPRHFYFHHRDSIIKPKEVARRDPRGITLPEGATGFYFYDEVRIRLRVGRQRICFDRLHHNESKVQRP